MLLKVFAAVIRVARRERQLDVLMAYLKRYDLLDRFELHELSPRCEGEFISKFDAFFDRIAAMPPARASDNGGEN